MALDAGELKAVMDVRKRKQDRLAKKGKVRILIEFSLRN
jgi:hypothetical protein